MNTPRRYYPVRDQHVDQRFAIAGEIKALHTADDGLGHELRAIAECVGNGLLNTAAQLADELEHAYPLIAVAVGGLVQAARFDAVGSADDASQQRRATLRWARHMGIVR